MSVKRTSSDQRYRAISFYAARALLILSVAAGPHVLTASAASAQSATPEKPVIMPAWTGFYAGVTAGPTWMKTGLTAATQSTDIFTTSTPPNTVFTQTNTSNITQSSSGSTWGGLADVHMGYNFRPNGNVVFGL